ncbi:MAG: four-helix bundle copper-binding protein [Acidimicrobiales bacterium]
MGLADVLADHPEKATFDLAELSRTIHACQEAAAGATACADACVYEGHTDEMRRCIKLDLIAAEICTATAKVLSRPGPGGDVWRDLVEVCAKACHEAAEECAKHDHEHCLRCAELCREAQKACQQLLAAAAK